MLSCNPLAAVATETTRILKPMTSATLGSAPESSLLPPATRGDEDIALSVVVPVLNEQDNVIPLLSALGQELAEIGLVYEVIVVDDGSTDQTYPNLARQAELDERLRLVKLRRNYGQAAALAAGFDHAGGEVIVTLDGDLQNDPADISLLLAKLDEGYDVVSGWRQNRQDSMGRRLPSRIANWLIGRVIGVRLHDYGCTLKAYRAEIAEETRLYGEMHRFLPALAHMAGARIAEVPVRHHPRTSGRSKYGIGRTSKVLLDLLTVKFLAVWSTKPSHVFGGSGVVLCLLGTSFVVWTAYEKLVNGIYVYRQPALLVGVFLFTIGINLVLLGLLAELIVRTHHESGARRAYQVRELRNFGEQTPPS